jgi:hypothetical protein
VLTLALLWSGANAQCDGSCQTNSESCSGSYKSGLCPGSSSVECCVEVCLYIFSDHSLCVCVLFFLLEHHLLYITSFALYIYQHTHTHTHKTTSSCNGQCQSTNAGLTCAGSYVAGLCPGSSNIECCVGTVPFADRYILYKYNPFFVILFRFDFITYVITSPFPHLSAIKFLSLSLSPQTTNNNLVIGIAPMWAAPPPYPPALRSPVTSVPSSWLAPWLQEVTLKV